MPYPRRPFRPASVRGVLTAGLFVLALFFSGCVTTPPVLYPNFPQKAKDLPPVEIKASIFVYTIAHLSSHYVDVSHNLDLGTGAVTGLKTSLQAAGYTVAAADLSGCGLSLNPLAKSDHRVREVGAPEQPLGDMPQHAPPFQVSPLLTDPEREVVLQIFRDLNGFRPKKTDQPQHLDAVKKLPGAADRAYLFVLINGQETSFGNVLGQALVTSLLTLGTVSTATTTVGTLTGCIIDGSTGEILWADSSFVPARSVIKPADIQTLVQALTARLPHRPPGS